jgi:proline iminopeptidase
MEKFFTIMAPLYSKKAQRDSSPPYSFTCSIKPLNEGFKTEFWKFDFIKDLKKITAKTLIIVGEDDWINQPDQAEITANGIVGSKLEIIKNYGHHVVTDQPEQYKNLIRNEIV